MLDRFRYPSQFYHRLAKAERGSPSLTTHEVRWLVQEAWDEALLNYYVAEKQKSSSHLDAPPAYIRSRGRPSPQRVGPWILTPPSGEPAAWAEGQLYPGPIVSLHLHLGGLLGPSPTNSSCPVAQSAGAFPPSRVGSSEGAEILGRLGEPRNDGAGQTLPEPRGRQGASAEGAAWVEAALDLFISGCFLSQRADILKLSSFSPAWAALLGEVGPGEGRRIEVPLALGGLGDLVARSSLPCRQLALASDEWWASERGKNYRKRLHYLELRSAKAEAPPHACRPRRRSLWQRLLTPARRR